MTTYRLTVVRVEDNPDYDAEKALRSTARLLQYGPIHEPTPAPTQDTRVLEVVLTEEEYRAAKKAVLETWQ